MLRLEGFRYGRISLLKPDAEPYHGKPFPVPRIHELTFKQELDRLEYLKVIKKINSPQWGAPTILIPKKDSTVRFISDFRELNILRVDYQGEIGRAS